jgi:hypothetical protein
MHMQIIASSIAMGGSVIGWIAIKRASKEKFSLQNRIWAFFFFLSLATIYFIFAYCVAYVISFFGLELILWVVFGVLAMVSGQKAVSKTAAKVSHPDKGAWKLCIVLFLVTSWWTVSNYAGNRMMYVRKHGSVYSHYAHSAQHEYFKANGHYTDRLEDLKAAYPDMQEIPPEVTFTFLHASESQFALTVEDAYYWRMKSIVTEEGIKLEIGMKKHKKRTHSDQKR